MAVLLEHSGGNLPLWLSPDQVIVLPISEKYNDYAEKVLHLLNNSEIRTLVDRRNEKAGKKIREAEMMKIPYMLVVGEREEAENTVSVRKHGQGDQGVETVESFINQLKREIEIHNI